MQDLPSVSIIIPCRNEKEFMPKCLDSLLANHYPTDKMEILIVDGMSHDGTRELIAGYAKKYPFISMLDNPKRITPSALNIGIKKSANNIIVRIDAHAVYKTDYILKCVTYLKKYNADNIGGIWVIVPRKNTIIGRGIAKSLSSFFGTGNAYYKIGSESFRAVDTVPFGCYKKEIFTKIGFFNENLERSQDIEFNIRLKKNGGKVYLFRFIKIFFKFRHYIPLMFVSLLIIFFALSFVSNYFLFFLWGLAASYLFSLVYFSAKISFLEKDFTYLFSLPLAFAARHFGYGFGSIWGAFKLIFNL